LANDIVAQAARRARIVVAEMNPKAPWTHGAELPEDIKPHVVVEARHPPLEFNQPQIGELERRIGAHVAELIPDRATIQLGVGAIPDAILASLSNHRNLGIHSGQIGDGVIDLIEAGVITNTHKGCDHGTTVCGSLFGTSRLYAYAHDNPSLHLRPPAYTHGLEVLRRIKRFTSINSAIEADLSGQINAEVADGVYLGALGGQLDFMRGANASHGGRSIIAMPATAKGGLVSRIVPSLSMVTCPRSDVDAVATEWGVAELQGRSLAERARRMIAIAAPQFRESLACWLHP
jgi:acetyl-CoA hydrolase